MKRKLDEHNSPAVTDKETSEATPLQASSSKNANESEVTGRETSFADLGLDPRLVQAVAQQSFEKPTLVQRKAIPLALNGQDLLAKSKTGSGKTAAYLLPVLQAILKRKQVRQSAVQRI